MIGSTNVPGLRYSQVTGITDQIERRIAKMNNIVPVVFSGGWAEVNPNDSATPWVKTVSITGYQGDAVTEDDRPEIYFDLSPYASGDMDDCVEQYSHVYKVVTGNGTISAYAYGSEPPTIDIYVDVKGV